MEYGKCVLRVLVGRWGEGRGALVLYNWIGDDSLMVI